MTALLIFAFVAAAFFSDGAKFPLDTSAADASPVFSLSVDKSTASQGDTVTVTFAVKNNTNMPVTSFSGRITYNKNYYQYMYFDYISSMNGTVQSDNSSDYITNNSVKFVFSDPSKKLIPNNGATISFFKVVFQVLDNAPVGNPYFGGFIDDCYGTNESDNDIAYTNLTPVVQKSITIKTTTTTRATTTTTRTTTTKTTTTTTTKATTSTNAIIAPAKSANLQSLQISPGTLQPEFNPNNVAYSVTVPYEVEEMRIFAVSADNAAFVVGNGTKPLAVGVNIFTITVTATDGTQKEYGLVVTREAQPESSSSEEVSSDELSSDTESGEEESSLYIIDSSLNDMLGVDDRLSGNEDDGNTLQGSPIKIVGIIFAEIALFFFGFLSGFYIDKANKQKREAEARARRSRRSQPPRRKETYYQEPEEYEEYEEEDEDEYEEYEEEYEDDEEEEYEDEDDDDYYYS
jgi:hypothetical protein